MPFQQHKSKTSDNNSVKCLKRMGKMFEVSGKFLIFSDISRSRTFNFRHCFCFMGLNFQGLFNKVVSNSSTIFQKQIKSLNFHMTFFIILILLFYIELRLYVTKKSPKFEGILSEMAGAFRPNC